MSIFKKVEKFNSDIIGINRNVATELSPEEHKWLVGALKEEISEYDVAFNQHDFVGQIDAIIDLIYFAAGALTRMGLSAEISNHIFNVVHQCNMQKVKGRKQERDISSDLDAVKPEDWSDPSSAIMDILNELKRG
jgi:predicted HAD superfamily Cof-like phosphohydrolase